mmetsp:Transcript_17478/g.37968  ORF Transcript_17478/g.37968 Transcript_17478/m.37968 type:complete len:231 (+) Transcript_17478:8-700(+)
MFSVGGGGSAQGSNDRARGGKGGAASGGGSLVEALNSLSTVKTANESSSASFWNSFNDSAPQVPASIRGFFGAGDVEMQSADGQQGLQDEMNEYLNLSYSQRLTLFAACFAGGVGMLFLAVLMLPMIVLRPAKFALAFTFGNLLCLGSTAFLVGVRAQLSAMFHPVRWVAACLYCGGLCITLFACFYGGSLRYLLVLASIIVEVLAMIWYALSYIPYARQLISSFFPGLI